jgi:hypothetical protein
VGALTCVGVPEITQFVAFTESPAGSVGVTAQDVMASLELSGVISVSAELIIPVKGLPTKESKGGADRTVIDSVAVPLPELLLAVMV